MRIGLDGSKALSPTDGIGRYTRELLRALAELDGGPEIELFGLPLEIDSTARAELAKLPPKVRLNHGWQIEIVSGLSAGETIAVSAVSALSEGMEVRPLEAVSRSSSSGAVSRLPSSGGTDS